MVDRTTALTGGNETRPVNVYVIYMIFTGRRRGA
jgi:hypothetical protein